MYEKIYYEMLLTQNPMNINGMLLELVTAYGRKQDTSFHWHSALEIVLLMEGTANYRVCGKEYIVKKDEMFLINIGDIHMTQNIDNFSQIEGMVILIPETFIKELVPESEQAYFELTDPDKKVLLSYLENIADYLTDKDNWQYPNLLIRIELLNIIYYLFSECCIKRTSHSHVISKKVIEYINQKYTEPLTVKKVAEYSGFSENYFCRYFKRETGISFHKYLCYLRLNAALELLATGNYSELEVALSVGFASTKILIEWCRKIYNCTPLEYIGKKEKQ